VSDHRVLVLAHTRHGWRRLCAFRCDDTGAWKPDAGRFFDAAFDGAFNEISTTGQVADGFFNQAVEELLNTCMRTDALAPIPMDPAPSPPRVIPLTKRVSVPMVILSAVFNAMRAENLYGVNIDDIKSVVSQYGWRLKRLEGLPEEKRRHAEKLLHPAILSIVLRSHRQQ
jgi:hypothetical protein